MLETVRKLADPLRFDTQQENMIQDENLEGRVMQMPRVNSRTGFRRSSPLQWSLIKGPILCTISNFARRYYITSPMPVDPLALHPTIVTATTFLPSIPCR